ncbi:MAG: type VI secretion system tube protein Hcp [Candidatus Aminicenantes bacterium]|nr:type VI secretion system tube protein Hcp [Candidatus Aminicenantes bacterium]MDH5742215.1 type VI secretion system tube protein Hcp [Candidatus Aminicenantes bacterium]
MANRKLLTGVFLVILLLAVDSLAVEYQAIMRISGVQGQSVIDIKATDWSRISGMPNPNILYSGKARDQRASRGNVAMNDFSLTKEIDKATPKIGGEITEGKHFDSIEIIVCKAGNEKNWFYKIKLDKVVATSVISEGGIRPVETVTFRYEKLTWEYKPPDED